MNPISLFSVKIDCLYNDKLMMTGTGFFYRHPSQKLPFLITNFHVLTARLPKTPSCLMSKQFGSSPNKLRAHVWGGTPLTCHTFMIEIDDESLWLEHPKRNDGVDIVGLPIIFKDNTPHTTQNDLKENEVIKIDIASDLFIVGYPLGLAVNERLPIWKKGTVASEPSVKIDDLDCFYIDASTKGGMSGSPVFASEVYERLAISGENIELYHKMQRGEISDQAFLSSLSPTELQNFRKVKEFRLVGLYSGRITMGSDHPDIGIVWKKELIDEMFESNNFVKAEFPPYFSE